MDFTKDLLLFQVLAAVAAAAVAVEIAPLELAVQAHLDKDLMGATELCTEVAAVAALEVQDQTVGHRTQATAALDTLG